MRASAVRGADSSKKLEKHYIALKERWSSYEIDFLPQAQIGNARCAKPLRKKTNDSYELRPKGRPLLWVISS